MCQSAQVTELCYRVVVLQQEQYILVKNTEIAKTVTSITVVDSVNATLFFLLQRFLNEPFVTYDRL
jgi:hypothetical protein